MGRNINQAAEQRSRDRFREVVGKQPKGVWLIMSTVALLLIVVGTVIPIFQGMEIPYAMQPKWFGYIYAAGAALLLISKIFTRYTGSVIRVKRLYRIETWSAIFFIVGAAFIWIEPTITRNWLAFTLAGGAIQIYTSIMIPRAINKALNKE